MEFMNYNERPVLNIRAEHFRHCCACGELPLKHMLTLLSLYHFFRRKCKPNILLTLLRDKLKSVLEEVNSTKIGNDSPLIS